MILLLARPLHVAALVLSLLAALAMPAHSAPVDLLFDTDMMTDCDDAGAMAVLHALADRGECRILATVVSSAAPKAALAVEIINSYYGRPELPLGMIKGEGVHAGSKFLAGLTERFPHRLTPTTIPDAAPL